MCRASCCNMSALYLCCVVFLTICSSTLADEEAGEGRVVQKHEGDNITIHCRTSQTDREHLSLYRRLTTETQVFNFYKNTEKVTIQDKFLSRLKNVGVFQNMSLTIENLTTEDSGVYWCFYNGYKKEDIFAQSVLLVVKVPSQDTGTDTRSTCPCDNEMGNFCSSLTVILVSAVIAGIAVLLCLVIFFTWVIPRLKAWRSTMRITPVRTNDVYEDMNFRRA
ncbi:hypothetical protein DPEC_G00307810 [Dallia pectoralis]|uniref:Uncharacterized protein n=1 Tax=Dallia pectoralis TaxID=75939 RepID=A0ACC2FEH1_DALPE|nr:hypothetical protein DPEC_G00307810 [Dallia pectoralis]